MAKSIQEIKNEILNELQIGIDENEGSFITSLVGAISTQIAMLEETIDRVKVQQLPEFADMETLVLLGRKCGLYPMAATASQISIMIDGADPGYAVGDTIRFKDCTWAYTVQSHEAVKHQYDLECAVRGTASNTIPPSWYKTEGVEIEPRSHGDPSVKARVVEILKQGRDDEDISQFRLRVMAAHSCRPVAANEQWIVAVLTQSGLPIGTVRVDQPTLLNKSTAANVDIYIGGLDYEPPSDRTMKACNELLSMNRPIGLTFTLKPVTRLVVKVKLLYSFIIDGGGDTPAFRGFAKGLIVAKLREHLRKIVTATPPREKIAIVPNELVGVVTENSPALSIILGCKITYGGNEYGNDTCKFQINDIPWVSTDQIIFLHKGGGEVGGGDDYPEW